MPPDLALPPQVAAQFTADCGIGDGPGRPARTVVDRDLPSMILAVRRARGAGAAAAGSLLVLAYARRLVWPVLGEHLLHGRWLDPAWANVVIDTDDPGGSFRIGFVGTPQPAGPAVGEVVTALVDGHLELLVEQAHRETRAGRRVLWGNVAVAVAQVFLALSWSAPHRDALAGTARDVLAAAPRLRGLVSVESVRHPAADGDRWMVVWRRTCCLAFRCAAADRPSYCGTCPVVPHRDRLASFHRAAGRYPGRPGGPAGTTT
ncbi:hypothetical protein GCM10009613_13570 [Pseudonocardia kongjuensis]|uniref:Aerobactin siderophore biosynthesis IucA/IucC-like C-terminal domain-containing protein n=1 Tax=Pseudonocardia kongjuensis TaxID=102227 RepID=A0ABP4I7N0_9PSEU